MGQRHCIVFGLGFYKYYNSLEHCISSAKSVYELLIDPTYGSCNPEKSTLHLATNEHNLLTHTDLIQLIGESISNVSFGNQWIFYYCGHARRYGDGELHLILSDSEHGKPAREYPFSNLIKSLSKQNISNAILIVDACQSGAMIDSLKNFQSSAELMTQLVNEEVVDIPDGIAMLAATARSEIAKQDDKLGMTLFSYYFCDGIKNWRYTSSPYIYINEIRDYINLSIKTKHTDHQQVAHSLLSSSANIWVSKNPSHLSNLVNPKLIPFTNRVEELNILCNPDSRYLIVTGPAGYGKSSLLKQTKALILSRDGETNENNGIWKCLYITIGINDSIKIVVEKLILELDYTIVTYNQYPPDSLLNLFLSKMHATWTSEPTIKGLVLLFDLENASNWVLVEEINKKVLHPLHNLLEGIAGNKSLRVIFAGRFKASGHFLSAPDYVDLKPFDYSVIRDTIFKSEFLKHTTPTWIDQLAAQLLFMTGGHPGCIARILKDYSLRPIKSPNHYVYEHLKTIQSWITDSFTEILQGIEEYPNNLRSIILELSVYRVLDLPMLEDFLTKNFTNLSLNARQLRPKLTATHLFQVKDRLLRDNIVRRLCAIQLRHTSPHKYKELCVAALQQAENRILMPLKGQQEEKWVIEYLFQCLQQHALEIDDRKQRYLIKQAFFEEYLPNALDKLSQSIEDDDTFAIADYITSLNADIEDDWEFQFALNFYLRDDLYEMHPKQRLLAQIEQYFKSLAIKLTK